jgi:hypothetical protein
MCQHHRLFASSSLVARLSAGAFVTTVGLALSPQAQATEGGIGRPINGMQIAPYAGIAPPTGDWILSYTSTCYEGSPGASKTIPVAGKITAVLDYHIPYNIVNAIRTWGITAGGWNFALSFGVLLQYTGVSSFHGRLPDDHATRFADIFFTPAVAGYRLTTTDHIALSVQIHAPTGACNTSRLANAGQNTWTLTPTFACTRLLPKEGTGLSLNCGIGFYTGNQDA